MNKRYRKIGLVHGWQSQCNQNDLYRPPFYLNTNTHGNFKATFAQERKNDVIFTRDVFTFFAAFSNENLGLYLRGQTKTINCFISYVL